MTCRPVDLWCNPFFFLLINYIYSPPSYIAHNTHTHTLEFVLEKEKEKNTYTLIYTKRGAILVLQNNDHNWKSSRRVGATNNNKIESEKRKTERNTANLEIHMTVMEVINDVKKKKT